MSVKLPYEILHVLIKYSNKIDISLARLITRCASFVMNRYTCYHMPVGLYNIVIEHGVGTHCFRSTLCSALDLVSFPSGRTSALGQELGTRLWFVDWITGEIVPLSCCYSLLRYSLIIFTEFTQSDQNAVCPVNNGMFLYSILRLWDYSTTSSKLIIQIDSFCSRHVTTKIAMVCAIDAPNVSLLFFQKHSRS